MVSQPETSQKATVQERDVIPSPGLLDVVGDEAGELGLGGQFALDDVGASLAGGWCVGDADDAEDALAAHDPLAGGDAVPRQLDQRAD
jgi:hypothetical protein